MKKQPSVFNNMNFTEWKHKLACFLFFMFCVAAVVSAVRDKDHFLPVCGSEMLLLFRLLSLLSADCDGGFDSFFFRFLFLDICHTENVKLQKSGRLFLSNSSNNA